MAANIYVLDRNMMGRLADVLPQVVVQQAARPGYFALGLVEGSGPDMKLRGMIQFYVNMTEKSEFYAELCYIYVPEAYRRKGVGRQLLEGMHSVLARSGIVASTFLIPYQDNDLMNFDIGTAEIELFFDSCGYVQAKRDYSMWIARLRDLVDADEELLTPRGVFSIGKVPKEDFAGLMEEIASSAKEGDFPADAGSKASDYDTWFSVCCDKKEGKGIMLFRRMGDMLMETALYRATGADPARVLKQLGLRAFRLCDESLSDDCIIVMRQEAVARGTDVHALIPGFYEMRMTRYVKLVAKK